MSYQFDPTIDSDDVIPYDSRDSPNEELLLLMDGEEERVRLAGIREMNSGVP